MHRRPAPCALAICLLLTACMPQEAVRPVVVTPPQVVVNPPPRHEAAALRQCIADNRRDHAEVHQIFQRARRAARISPAEARDFDVMDERLRRHERALARDGLTLDECERIGREIARERDAVRRMARHDDGTSQCRQDARRAHAEVVHMYRDAERAGRITPDERRRFDDRVERLRRHEAVLSRDGLTLEECGRLQAMIADDREFVRRMARRDPGVGQCRRDNQRAHAEVMAVFADAERGGRISSRERRRFDDLMRGLREYEAALASDGLTLAECQALARAIAADGREVRRMAGDR